MARVRAKRRHAIFQVLTPEQITKWLSMKEQRMDRK
jgi:Spy/CpxP family protein refolding chaperone